MFSSKIGATNASPMYCGAEPDKDAVNHLAWDICRQAKLAETSTQMHVDRHYEVTEVLPPYHGPSTMDQIMSDPALTTAVIMGGVFIVAILVIAFAFMSSRSNSGRHQ